MNAQQLANKLAQFSGTTHWYKIYPNVYLTEGVKYLCQEAQAYWLIDIIWSYQTHASIRKEPFQRYTLTVDLEQQTAVLSCTDGNNKVLKSQAIDYTDFPLREIKLYFTNQVVLLPSEY